MAKPEWGVKRICPNCGTRYYDMGKQPPACPKCGVEYDPEALLKSRRSRNPIVEEPVRKSPVDEDVEAETEEVLEDEEALEEAEGDEDSVIEDASDLDDGMDVDVDVDVESGDEDEET